MFKRISSYCIIESIGEYDFVIFSYFARSTVMWCWKTGEKMNELSCVEWSEGFWPRKAFEVVLSDRNRKTKYSRPEMRHFPFIFKCVVVLYQQRLSTGAVSTFTLDEARDKSCLLFGRGCCTALKRNEVDCWCGTDDCCANDETRWNQREVVCCNSFARLHRIRTRIHSMKRWYGVLYRYRLKCHWRPPLNLTMTF